MQIKISGHEYDLLFNGAAMFAIRDLYQDDNVIELIAANDALAFQRTCKIAVILAEQGELLRRYMGHEPREMLLETALLATVTPLGIVQLKTAVLKTFYEGYSRQVKDDEEIDVVLAELSKKKATN